jgi:hypothetical protein
MKKTLFESLSPEVQKRASEIFKSIIDSQVDKLLIKYGDKAEEVAYGMAINQAKKESEPKPEEVEEINSIEYINEVEKKIQIQSLVERTFKKLRNK